MKKSLGTMIALAVLALLISSAQAAMRISKATIQNGQVVIAGSKAPRSAEISWEGVSLGINSSSGGGFSFNTTLLPADCVGRLKIGAEERDVVIGACTPAPITVVEAGVPKTGQLSSFATGDDGNLQKGVPSPDPRFTDNGDGTITDNLTRLIWLKNMGCQSGPLTWQQALNFVAGINAGTNNCGDASNAGSHQTDWRLPNVRELLSLVDYGWAGTYALGLPIGHPFTNVQQVYWTSTANGGQTWVKYIVSFGGLARSGCVNYQDQSATTYFDYIQVTAVRDGF